MSRRNPLCAPKAWGSLIQNNAKESRMFGTTVESGQAGTMDRDNKLRQGQDSCWVNAKIPLGLFLLRPIPSPSSEILAFLTFRKRWDLRKERWEEFGTMRPEDWWDWWVTKEINVGARLSIHVGSPHRRESYRAPWRHTSKRIGKS